MERIVIATQKPRQVIDLTDQLNKLLTSKFNNVGEGICYISALHTTTALSVADLDPGTDLDMLDAFEAMVPKLNYRHPHDPSHVPDHILSTLIGPSVTLPIENGQLVLGAWQRVVLFEFSGPRKRELVIIVK